MVYIQERGLIRDVYVDNGFEVEFHNFLLKCIKEDSHLKYSIQIQCDLSRDTEKVLEEFSIGDRPSSLVKPPEGIYSNQEDDYSKVLHDIELYPPSFQQEIKKTILRYFQEVLETFLIFFAG